MTKISQDSKLQKSSVKNEPFFFASEKKVTQLTPTSKATRMTPLREITNKEARAERMNMVQGFNPSKYLNSQLRQISMKMKIDGKTGNDKKTPKSMSVASNLDKFMVKGEHNMAQNAQFFDDVFIKQAQDLLEAK